jgi:PAS domain S-box-containing protein
MTDDPRPAATGDASSDRRDSVSPGATSRPRRRLAVPVLTGVIAVAIIALIGFFYFQHAANHRDQTLAALNEVARLKSSEAALWMRERRADAGILLDDAALARNMQLWFEDGRPQDFERDSVPFLEAMARRYGYTVVAALDGAGTVRYSVSNRTIADTARVRALLGRAALSGRVAGSDLYLGADGTPYIDWVVPMIVGSGDRSTFVGGILLRSDPARYLYPLLASWPGREPSAETLLVRRDGDRVVYLNDLRFRDDAALRLSLSADSPDFPAGRAVTGGPGASEGVDYRGHEVLAAYRPVPATDWGIVAKVDRDDVFAPVTREAWLVVLLTAALLGVGALTVGFYWRRQEVQTAKAAAAAAGERAALAEHYQLLSKHANDAMLLVDEDRRIIECNERAADVYGHTREELLSMSLPDLLAEGAVSPLHGGAGLLESGGSAVFETRHRRADGSELDVEVSARIVDTDGRRYYQEIVRDVSDRVAAERALAERERMLSTLLGNLPGIAYRCRNESGWTMEFISDGCRDLTGYDAEELTDDRVVSFEELMHRDDRAMVRAEVERSLADGDAFTVIYRIAHRNGSERWVWDRGRPVTTPGVRSPGVHEGFITDVTARVVAERELRELSATLERRVEERTADLRAANRELEAFSYSVSHDLRAPLRAIDGFSLALAEDFGDELPEEGRVYLRRVRAASQRMGDLIDDLLSLSRVTRSDMTLTTVDLSALALEVVDELRSLHDDDAVDFVVAPGMTTVADAHLVRLLLVNLLDNARKFSRPVEHPRVELGSVGHGGGARTTLFVRDNGVGFDVAFAERLFAPFQRFHAPGDFAGTGVGLAIARRVVRRHGGWIWAESAPDQGTTFYFTFAVGSDSVAGDRRAPAAEHIAGAGGEEGTGE